MKVPRPTLDSRWVFTHVEHKRTVETLVKTCVQIHEIRLKTFFFKCGLAETQWKGCRDQQREMEENYQKWPKAPNVKREAEKVQTKQTDFYC